MKRIPKAMFIVIVFILIWNTEVDADMIELLEDNSISEQYLVQEEGIEKDTEFEQGLIQVEELMDAGSCFVSGNNVEDSNDSVDIIEKTDVIDEYEDCKNEDDEKVECYKESMIDFGKEEFDVPDSVLAFIDKNRSEIVFCCDLFSIDGEPTYGYVTFDKGYCIYFKSTNYIIEFSESSTNGPYYCYESYDKYYIGPTMYFYFDGVSYRSVETEERVNIEDYCNYESKLYSIEKNKTKSTARKKSNLKTYSNNSDMMVPNDRVKYDSKTIKDEDAIIKMPIGKNLDNTCGIIGSSMLLTYYDHKGFDLIDDDKDPYLLESTNGDVDKLHKYLLDNYRFERAGQVGTYPWNDADMLNNYLGNERPNSCFNARVSYTGSEIISQIEKKEPNPVVAYGSFDFDPKTSEYEVDARTLKSEHAVLIYGYAYGAEADIYYKCHYGWFHRPDLNDVWISSEMYLIGGIVYLEQTEPHKHISGHIYDADLLDMNGRHLYSCSHPNCNALMSDDCPDDYRFAETIEPKFTSETPDYHFGGKIDRKDDTDVYRFSLSETMYLSCEMDFDRQGEVGIYDKDYNLIQGTTAAARRQICNLLLDRGVYYISIKANDEQGYAGDIRYSQYDIEGDSKEAPYSLALNGTVQAHAGRVDKANDEDWLSFDVPYKSHVTVVTKAGGNNLMMRIYDGNNATLVTVNSNNVQKEAAMNHRLLDAGKYYIRVSSPNLQSYDVNVSIDTQEDTDADSLNEAKEIKSINADGQTVYRKESKINYTGDADCYYINLPYRSHITVSTKASNSSLMMQLYKEDKTCLRTVNSNNVGTEAKINYILLEPGKYYVRVSSNSEQDYAIKVTVDTLLDTEPDKFDEAEGIDLVEYDGKPECSRTGRINYTGDVDYFFFEIPYKGHVSLNVKAENSTLMMRLYNEANSCLRTVNSKNVDIEAKINYMLLEPGKYYVRVSANSEQVYTLEVSVDTLMDEENDTFSDAKEISFEKNTDEKPAHEGNGRINYSGDVDWVVFEIPYKSHVTFATKAENTTLMMQLYNEANSCLRTVNSKNVDFEAKINYMLLEPGKYYVRISSNTEQEYTLKVMMDTLRDAEPDVLNDAELLIKKETSEVEAYSKAGLINYSGDSDCFSFEVPYKCHVTVTVVAKNTALGLYFYGTNKNHMYTSWTNNTAYEAVMRYRLLEPGNYFVKLASNSEQDYELRVTFDTKEDREPDILAESETMIKQASEAGIKYEKEATVNYSGDNDCFVFEVPYKGHATVKMKAENTSAVMYVYNSQYSNIYTAWTNNTAYEATLKFRLLEPGKYYVKTASNTVQDYVLSVSMDTENDTEPDVAEGAYRISGNELGLSSYNLAYRGVINYSSDTDCYYFELPNKGSVTVEADAENSSLCLGISDAQNKRIYTAWSNAVGCKASMNNRMLEAGRYYILVSSNSVQNYELKIKWQ